jgi:hypothetical protein
MRFFVNKCKFGFSENCQKNTPIAIKSNTFFLLFSIMMEQSIYEQNIIVVSSSSKNLTVYYSIDYLMRFS